jgi:hypothetical protein
MMTNSKLIFNAILTCLLACGCINNPEKQQEGTADSIVSQKKNGKLTFLDSVSAQMDIPFAQLKRHIANTADFYSKWYYKGDTVYYPAGDYSLAIILADDHLVAAHRYLLVCKRNSLKKGASLLVATDDDEDYGTDYSRMEYKIFNPWQFYTREIEHLRKAGEKTKVRVTDRFYAINKKGSIDPLSKKPAGVVVPVFDTEGELTEEDN